MDPAIDYLIEGISANQEDDEAIFHWGRALDRVLTWNHYVIPQWHTAEFWVSYNQRLQRPEVRPRYAPGIDIWWIKR